MVEDYISADETLAATLLDLELFPEANLKSVPGTISVPGTGPGGFLY